MNFSITMSQLDLKEFVYKILIDDLKVFNRSIKFYQKFLYKYINF
jgi:hypothetical protein